MPDPISYEATDEILFIDFRSTEIDLRDVAILANGLHRSINNAFISMFAPEIYDLVRLSGRRRFDDPLFISLAVEELRSGSLLAKCRLRLSPRVRRDLMVGTAGSLIATILWAIGSALPSHSKVPPRPELIGHVEHIPDVGPNVRTMVNGLSETGRPWELRLRDAKSEYEVTIRSR